MRSVELNPKDNFDSWDPKWASELKRGVFNNALGHELLFANDYVKLWEIMLLPKERMTFRLQQSPYVWVCETGGLAISRMVSGQICMYHFEKDDSAYFKPNRSKYVRDLENIGEELLKMTIVEFTKKPMVMSDTTV